MPLSKRGYTPWHMLLRLQIDLRSNQKGTGDWISWRIRNVYANNSLWALPVQRERERQSSALFAFRANRAVRSFLSALFCFFRTRKARLFAFSRRSQRSAEAISGQEPYCDYRFESARARSNERKQAAPPSVWLLLLLTGPCRRRGYYASTTTQRAYA